MSRAALLAWVWIWLLCSGFEWPGRLAHLQYELKHADAPTRRDAVQRLGSYPAAEVREALLTALEDDDVEVRKGAARSVAQIQLREAAPLLAAWLGDRDGEVRAAAIAALGALAESSAREPLTRALSDALPAVRREAARALAGIADDEALAGLLTATSDADPSVRTAAVSALRGRVDGRALPALTSRLRDESEDVRIAALQVLGGIADPRALPLVARAAETEHGRAELTAIIALGELGARLGSNDAETLATLRRKLDAEPRATKAAIAALGRLEHSAALGTLVDTLASPELALAAQNALLERARRNAGTARAKAQAAQLSAALLAALDKPKTPEQVNIVADLAFELAAFMPSDALRPGLLRALSQGRGDPGRLSRALAATAAPDALVPLLERLARLNASAAAELDRLLDAMLPYFEAGSADGRATDALLAQLAAAHPPAVRAKLIALIGLTHAPRALPALQKELVHPELVVQLAAAEAVGRTGAPEGLAVLVPLLRARRADVRMAAARAYGQLAREPELLSLLPWLDTDSAADRSALLTAAGLALSRLRAQRALSEAATKRALETLSRWIATDDLELSARAVDALRRFGHEAGAQIIARELLSPKLTRRATATFALSDFPGDETRRLLRFVLQRSAPRASIAALLALGEIGDQRDVPALARIARFANWPLPAAATFALQRIAQQPDVKKKAFERAVCDLTEQRDPYARANIVSALTALGASGCPNLDIASWYAATEPSVVRAAVARWLRVRSASSPEAEAQLADALAACSSDPDRLVRAACAPNTAPAPALAPVDILAHDADGHTPLRQRLVALRFSDASAFVGYTDVNGSIQLTRAPAGPIDLEDPGE